MSEQIHCDLLEIYGPDWSSIDDDKIECVIKNIFERDLFGEEGEMYGFVGAARQKNVVGGFVVIQYHAELLDYDRDKTLTVEEKNPFEKLFFMFFPNSGRVLLQSKRFRVIPISMEAALERFRIALSKILEDCKVGFVLNFIPPHRKRSISEVLDIYQRSDVVRRLRVVNPAARQIPEDIEFYNPKRERNKIIRQAQVEDLEKLRRIEVEAKEEDDLKNTHIGKGLVHTISEVDPFLMEVNISGERHVIMNEVKSKYEFNVDMSAEELDKDRLEEIIIKVRSESGLDLDTPFDYEGPRQRSMYEFGESFEDTDA